MGTTLTGQTQSSTYDALLKITDNGPVGGALKVVTDGLGNDSALQVSTAGIASTGTLAVTGATTLAALSATTAAFSSTLAVSGVSSLAAGAVGAPGLYLGADTTTGWYRIGANNVGFAISGVKLLDLASAAVGITGTLSVSGTSTLAGLTASGTIAQTTATAFGSIFVNAAAGTERTMGIKSAGNARWYWGASNAAEGGSNAGSDFFLASATDGGAFLANVISVVRSTGVVTIGTLAVTNGVTAASLTVTGAVSDAGGNVRIIPQNSQSAPYTLVLTDSGKHILHPSADTTARTFTIPANASVAFVVGTAVTFINQNAAGVVTIAITTDTMRLAGPGTTGNRTLAANGVCTAVKITATEWIISGTGLT